MTPLLACFLGVTADVVLVYPTCNPSCGPSSLSPSLSPHYSVHGRTTIAAHLSHRRLLAHMPPLACLSDHHRRLLRTSLLRLWTSGYCQRMAQAPPRGLWPCATAARASSGRALLASPHRPLMAHGAAEFEASFLYATNLCVVVVLPLSKM
jgi:hypothetical protein